MDFNKSTGNILLIGLVVLIIILAVLAIWNLNLANEISKSNKENQILDLELQENISKLINKSSELNLSQAFLNSYLQGLGKYYIAQETNDNADYKLDNANERYNDGYWSKALAWYWDAIEWYNNSRSDYESAKNVFIKAENYTINKSYKDICNKYVNIMDTNSIAILYMYEAMDYYSKACEYYIDGKNSEAITMRELAEDKISFYEEEISKIENYQSELKNLLIEFG